MRATGAGGRRGDGAALGPGASGATARRYAARAAAGVAALGIALSAAACVGGDARPGKDVVVLFDLSLSTGSPEVRDAYCENFREVLSGVSHGDALAAGWIVESSVTQPTLPVDTTFTAFDPETTNPLLEEAQRTTADSALAAARDSIHARTCRRLKEGGRSVTSTDIITSLDLAADILAAGEGTDDRLVIMSDMLEDSERYQFDELDLGASQRSEILGRERERGRIPDLEGVSVCVVGAGERDTDRYYQVEEFWTAYFDSAGAELVSYGGPYIGC